MDRHRFDPLSAVLGLVAVTIGLLVATDSLHGADTGLGWWLAAGSLVVGLAIVPWGTRRDPAAESAELAVQSADEVVPGDPSPPN